MSASVIICPRPYTTSNDEGAIPCGITYADAIGYNKFQILRILAIIFCFTLLIITIIQCIRLIYYRGLRPIVQIHGMYALVFISVASQAVRSIDPQGWSVTLHPGANQILGDMSTCSILCTVFLVAMSWLKLMRRIEGKRESKIYQLAEWVMPCGLFLITFVVSVIQSQVHKNPGTYVFTVTKYIVFVLFILSFTITLWTQGIPLFIALNQSNGVSGSSIPSSSPKPEASKLAASPSSPPRPLRSQPSSSALNAHLIHQSLPVSVSVSVSVPVSGMQVSPNQVNIEMIDMESTTCGNGDGDGEHRSSVTTNHTYTNHTYSSKQQQTIFPDHIQPVRTSINVQNQSSSKPVSAASSPSMGYVTRTISTPSASASPDVPIMMRVTTTASASPSSSSHSNTGKKKAKMTRILKLIVAASCVSLAAVGFMISRLVGDYTSKFDEQDRPRPVPVGTFGSIFPNILLGILEYLACVVILSFFRHMRGDGGNAYSDTPQKQSKNITNIYTQQTPRTIE